jgi:hypothetical protein
MANEHPTRHNHARPSVAPRTPATAKPKISRSCQFPARRPPGSPGRQRAARAASATQPTRRPTSAPSEPDRALHGGPQRRARVAAQTAHTLAWSPASAPHAARPATRSGTLRLRKRPAQTASAAVSHRSATARGGHRRHQPCPLHRQQESPHSALRASVQRRGRKERCSWSARSRLVPVPAFAGQASRPGRRGGWIRTGVRFAGCCTNKSCRVGCEADS